jgi:hypothetical protein
MRTAGYPTASLGLREAQVTAISDNPLVFRTRRRPLRHCDPLHPTSTLPLPVQILPDPPRQLPSLSRHAPPC